MGKFLGNDEMPLFCEEVEREEPQEADETVEEADEEEHVETLAKPVAESVWQFSGSLAEE